MALLRLHIPPKASPEAKSSTPLSGLHNRPRFTEPPQNLLELDSPVQSPLRPTLEAAPHSGRSCVYESDAVAAPAQMGCCKSYTAWTRHSLASVPAAAGVCTTCPCAVAVVASGACIPCESIVLDERSLRCAEKPTICGKKLLAPFHAVGARHSLSTCDRAPLAVWSHAR